MNPRSNAAERLRLEHPELHDGLLKEIELYVNGKQKKFDQTTAGRDILSNWAMEEEWNRVVGDASSGLFCELLEEYVIPRGWKSTYKTHLGRKTCVYTRR